MSAKFSAKREMMVDVGLTVATVALTFATAQASTPVWLAARVTVGLAWTVRNSWNSHRQTEAIVEAINKNGGV